jgi:hypothetical protein
MKRHWLAVAVVVVVLIAAGLFPYSRICPVCHLGILMPPEAVAAKGDIEPSKNLVIWNGSSHGANYEDYSKICTRCWMAFDPKRGLWERASEVPGAFWRPLNAAIRHVPLPPAEHIHYRVVYRQYFRDHQFGESVTFYCDDIAEVLQPLRAYAAAHSLRFSVDQLPPPAGQRLVSIQTERPPI